MTMSRVCCARRCRHAVVGAVLALLALLTLHLSLRRLMRCPDDAWLLGSDEFEGFDNERGSSVAIVPNLVHFVRIDKPTFSFADTVCVLAALKHQNPDRIYFHTNENNFSGNYWEYLLETPKFANIYEINKIKKLPNKIFQQQLSNIWHTKHMNDIVKIFILIQYGGIVLNNNIYIVKKLDKYRHFEMIISWDEIRYLGTQLLIAHPDARFPRLWLESYRDNYKPELEDFNSRVRPSRVLLHSRPQLAHRVTDHFGDQDLSEKLYHQQFWSGWRKQFAINLNNGSFSSDINHVNVLNLHSTFGEMAREVYFDHL